MTDKIFFKTLEDFPSTISRSTLISRLKKTKSDADKWKKSAESWNEMYLAQTAVSVSLKRRIDQLESSTEYMNLRSFVNEWAMANEKIKQMTHFDVDRKSILQQSKSLLEHISKSVNPMYFRERSKVLINKIYNILSKP